MTRPTKNDGQVHNAPVIRLLPNETIDHEEVLSRIATRMSGRYWDCDCIAEIADILTSAGYKLAEPSDDEPEPEGNA